MSSELKTNLISPATGTALQISHSGDTTTIPSGATLVIASGATLTNSGTATGFGSDNTPAWHVYRSASQTIADDTSTKVEYNLETIDTDSAYDNSTNYRFTVPSGEGGNYFVYATGNMYGTSLSEMNLQIKLNGSNIRTFQFSMTGGHYAQQGIQAMGIIPLSAGDYLEVFAHGQVGSGSVTFYSSGTYVSYFGGFKLGF
jgi:hypothetical protein